MKSKIIKKTPINWEQTIVVDNIMLSPQLIQSHKDKINTIFANYPEQYRDEQLNKVVLHDVLFSRSMDMISPHYEVSFADEELKYIKDSTKNNFPNLDEKNIEIIAKKTIIKQLIFADLQEEFQITVDDEEIKKVLLDYYETTNQSIRNFMNDEKQKEIAKNSILNEKTIAFLLKKIKFDLSILSEKIKQIIEDNKKANSNN